MTTNELGVLALSSMLTLAYTLYKDYGRKG